MSSISVIIIVNPIRIIHQEFDFYCELYDRLEGADARESKIIRTQMRASTKRFQAMEEIMWKHKEDIGSASDEIQRVYPIERLPHEHPRRRQTIIN
jgi:hypothetical protein